MSPLVFLILLLILTSIFCYLSPASARRTAFMGSALQLILFLSLLLIYLFRVDDGAEVFYGWKWELLPELGVVMGLGMDGFSAIMLLLATLVMFAAVWATPAPERSVGFYYGNLFLIAAGVVGAFASTDLLFFYLFHELALIPTFLMIGIWGTGDKHRVAWKVTIYLALASFVLLIGILGLYINLPEISRTFGMRELVDLANSGVLQTPDWVFVMLFLGFGALVSLFPFHTWAPGAYACAPSSVAMLHAGVLKKFGLYGLLRVVLPIFPHEMQEYGHVLLILILGNIFFVGYATMAQRRLDWMLGYSSVMHMGYIFLGIASAMVPFAGGGGSYYLNPLSLGGAGILMFAHGISIAILFALSGQLRRRTATLEFSELGGMGKTMPAFGLLMGMGTFASIGLPGFANFSGELLVFFGAFGSGGAQFLNFYQIATAIAVWGVVVSAIYGLRAYRWTCFGETPERWVGSNELVDLRGREKFAIWILVVFSLLVGFWPQGFLKLLIPALLAQ
ncbi:MAG: NADH-quinone oxidoreductase subunit M [Chthoniobacterales bacterium]|nr:NADH-quinone oxidoreductase subunit M [Chthoniobacterales bacterium]